VIQGLWEQIEELSREVERLKDGFEDWTPGMKLESGDEVRIMGEIIEVTNDGCPSTRAVVFKEKQTSLKDHFRKLFRAMSRKG
jgi:hypothetical protein